MFKGIKISLGILSPSFEMVCCQGHMDMLNTSCCFGLCLSVLPFFLKKKTLETTSSACHTVNVNQPSLQ